MSIAEFLGQPLILAAAGLGVAGVAAAAWVMRRNGGTPTGGGSGKKSIIVFSPKDKRGKELRIKEETETRLDCGKVGSVDVRYYKTGPGWNFPGGATRFLGIDGTAYTSVILDDKPRQVTLPEALRILWGDAAYAKMPQTLKDPLERHQIGVTIQPTEVPTEDKNLKINAEDRDKENIKAGMDELRHNMKNKHKPDWAQLGGAAAIGILIGVLMVNWNVIKLG